jgi:hypothetical protein
MDGIPDQNWYAVPAHGSIATALHNLRAIPAEGFGIGAGPGFCRQIACASNAAIWCCNDVSPSFSCSPILPSSCSNIIKKVISI